jgi:regulator of RNase E activity RraA
MTLPEVPALAAETLERLSTVSSATVSMQLLKRGIRRTYMRGPRALDPSRGRLVGEAFTFRFVPGREDVSTPDSYARPGGVREAIEAVTPAAIVVIDACGAQDCATLGDILIARLQVLGCAGVISDGPMRDVKDVRALGLPVFCTGAAAPPSIEALAFAGYQEVIGCGGVQVRPGDVIIGDADGVVVLPRALADEVAAAAPEQERFERYAKMRIGRGDPVVGVYPPNEATLANYAAWLDDGEPSTDS